MTTKTKSGREDKYIVKDLDKAAETAIFYGFQNIKTPKIEKCDIDQASSVVTVGADTIRHTLPRAEEKISLLRTLAEWNLHETGDTLMVHYKRAVNQLPIKKSTDDRFYNLDILGSTDSISEAIAIRTALAILAEHGITNLIVDINSIGDKHSVAQFEKELTNFSKKHGADMPPEVRQQLKKDPFDVWRLDHEKWLDIRKKAPQSLSFLSEHSVGHFQGVLEHLETLDIPYRISPSLMSHRHYCSHTVFEIKSIPSVETPQGAEKTSSTGMTGAITNTETIKSTTGSSTNTALDNENVFAVGTRHNYLARRIGYKKETPLMSVSLRFKKPPAQPKLFFKTRPNPKFFFIQFGASAKLKSLGIIESLRQARIPVHHMLTSDKFVGQLAAAESLKTPYVIIMGQKEALENSVVVREMNSRSQHIVPIQNLATYLSKI